MKKTNHPLHLILTLLTGGLWLFVWIPLVNARKRSGTGGNAANVVRVQFRELASAPRQVDPSNLDEGYAYVWKLPANPEIGMRVFVPGGEGRAAAAIIIGFGTMHRGPLSAVTRVATADEIEAASIQAAADEDIWLQLARRAAGLPSNTRRRKEPDGFPRIAPVDGKASAEEATVYAGMWWRVFKTAQGKGWPPEEIRVVESIARRWYAVRDKGGNVA